MRILIVDDEPLARERLRSLVAELGGDEIIGEAGDGLDAIDAVQNLNPDLVLLDIRMPGMDGLEVARHLRTLANPPAVVFATAFGDHALAAFEANAIDYLLKPIRAERLAVALERVRGLAGLRREVLPAAGARTHLSAVVKGRLQLIPVAEIRYLHADQKYVEAVWPEGRVLIEDSLRSLEAEFPRRFLRVHRNALVAVDYVAAVERLDDGETVVALRGMPDRVAVSRRLAGEVRQRLRALGGA
ncbi:MAG: response regulator [Gammaproteobacteria bacterium]|nr:response regulator [Gammaproteobacteria bacterium]MCG3142862.1 Transcriptional regulatory protein BtsR [Gammaproteobacteria bacterium]